MEFIVYLLESRCYNHWCVIVTDGSYINSVCMLIMCCMAVETNTDNCLSLVIQLVSNLYICESYNLLCCCLQHHLGGMLSYMQGTSDQFVTMVCCSDCKPSCKCSPHLLLILLAVCSQYVCEFHVKWKNSE